MTSKFDYYRLTFKHENEPENIRDEYGKTPFEHCMSTLRVTLLLDDLFKKMSDCGHCRYYDRRYAYENISLKVPTAENYARQGVCLEFSSQGLDYFYEYLAGFGLDFRTWLGMVRALCFNGYIVNVPRVDYAMDNIVKRGEESVISLKRVINAIADGELCCKARVWSDQGDDFKRLLSFRSNHKRVRGEDLEGLTIQLGSRDSETICRFYDKLTEQKQKHNEIPEDCVAWTRCEFEFKGSNAMSVMNAFIDYDEKQFGEYMCGVALNYCRFVERTSDNVSRCQNKRWWKEFLNGATKSISFDHIKPARSAFARFSKGFKRQWLASVYTVIDTVGFDRFSEWLEQSVYDEVGKGRVLIKPDLRQNILDGVNFYETMTGFKQFDYNSPLPSDILAHNIHEQHFEYFQQFYKIVRLDQRPNKFLEGQVYGL